MARINNDLYEGLTTASSPRYGFFDNWKKSDLIRERVNQLKEMEDYKERLTFAQEMEDKQNSEAKLDQFNALKTTAGFQAMPDEVAGLERSPDVRAALIQRQAEAAAPLSTANVAAAEMGRAPTVGAAAAAQGRLGLGTANRAVDRLELGPTGRELADQDANILKAENFQTTVNRLVNQEKINQGQPAADVRADVADARVRSTVAPGREARQLAENEEATEGSTWRSVYKMPELSAENSSLRAKDSNRYTTLKLGLGGPEAEAKADVAKATLDAQNSRENTLSLENSAKVENLKGELAVKLAELGLSTAEQNLMEAEIINHMTGKPTSNPAALQFIEDNPEISQIMMENKIGAYRPSYRTTTTGTSFGDGAGARPKTAKEIENEKLLMDFFAP